MRKPTAAEIAEGMGECADYLRGAISEAQSLLDDGAVSDEIGAIIAAIARIEKRAQRMAGSPRGCEVCGKPIGIQQHIIAESRGQIARYDSITCRRTAEKRRERA